MSNSNEWRPLGRIVGLYRYPLKGCQGEELTQTKIGWHGLTHDRGYALHRTGDLTGLPWASPRQFPQLLSWAATVPAGSTNLAITTGNSDDPEGGWVTDPRDPDSRARFAKHASDLLDEHVTLMNLWSGTHDSMPISIISTETIAAARDLLNPHPGPDTALGTGPETGQQTPLDVRRFRPNIVLETSTGRPWPERQWLGREVRLGDTPDAAILRIDRHTTRCEALDHHPTTGALVGDNLFDAIRTGNRNRAGVYATPRHVGHATLGHTVWTR